MPRHHRAFARDDHRPFQHIAQFPHVAGPGMLHQAGKRLRMKLRNAIPAFLVQLPDHGVGDMRNIFQAMPQRRQFDVKNIQPVIQILAQHPLFDRFERRTIGGRQHPHVHRNLILPAQAPDLGFFQNPQQLGLHSDGHFRDLIQEQRAPVGILETARASPQRTRESSFFVPEQFCSRSGSPARPRN